MKPQANLFYEELERKFVSWAQTVEDIRAAFVVGSRARNDHPADEWSDLDIVFFTCKQSDYLLTNNWLKNFGDIWASLVSQTAGGDSERLALFDGGWQVDFVVQSTEDLNQIVKKKITPKNFYRGVKLLIDKENIAKNIMPKSFGVPEVAAVSEDAFVQSVTIFWFLALYLAKQILRNDLWVAKVRDGNMKELLLQMIEWHEKMENGTGYDTWHAGRFLCEWAGEETQAELRNSFGHFDKSDSWKALVSSITLYQRLAHEVSRKMSFSYPYDLENHVDQWIRQNENWIQ